MLGISPLFRDGIIHNLDIVPVMYYDIPPNDAEQLDLPFSPYRKFYIKWTPLHPKDSQDLIIRTERERLKTFYTKNALPLKEVWPKKRITKIPGFGIKVLSKFELNCILFKYYIIRNKPDPLNLPCFTLFLFKGAFNANQSDRFHSIFLASLCYLLH